MKLANSFFLFSFCWHFVCLLFFLCFRRTYSQKVNSTIIVFLPFIFIFMWRFIEISTNILQNCEMECFSRVNQKCVTCYKNRHNFFSILLRFLEFFWQFFVCLWFFVWRKIHHVFFMTIFDQLKAIEEECGCVIFYMPRLHQHSRICTRASSDCYNPLRISLENGKHPKYKCLCYPPCDEIKYSGVVSTTPLIMPSPHAKSTLSNFTMEKIR